MIYRDIYLKLKNAGGSDTDPEVNLDADEQSFTALELFEKYGSPTSSAY